MSGPNDSNTENQEHINEFCIRIGIGTQNNQGEWLEVFYQQPVITPITASSKWLKTFWITREAIRRYR